MMPGLTNAFHPEFLELLGCRDAPVTAEEATAAGPWRVMEDGTEGYAVLHAGVTPRAQLRPLAWFRRRPLALLAAAVLPGTGEAPALHLCSQAGRLGYALHEMSRPNGLLEVGWLADFNQAWAYALACARSLARGPAGLASFLEGVGHEALEIAGALLTSRLAASGGRHQASAKPSPVRPAGGNAFSPEVLDLLGRQEAPPTAVEAASAGPWRVVELSPRRHAVVREGGKERPAGLFKDRSLALLAAATLPASGRAPLFVLRRRPSPPHQSYRIYDLSEVEGLQSVGSFAVYHPRWLAHLACAAHLARDPAGLSQLLEGVGSETLEIVGALLAARMAEATGEEARPRDGEASDPEPARSGLAAVPSMADFPAPAPSAGGPSSASQDNPQA